MNHQYQLEQHPNFDAFPTLGGPGHHAPSGQPNPHHTNPFVKIHALLRGRYHWAALLGIVLATIGTLTAYQFYTPLYSSSVMISIKPTKDNLLSNRETVMPLFQSFVALQAELVKSQRVINMAMNDDNWKSLKRGTGPDAIVQFRDSLDVYSDRNNQYIRVIFTDPDIDASAVAAKAVVGAYMKVYGESEAKEQADALKTLEARRATYNNQLSVVRTQIQTIARDYGSDSLERMYTFALENLQKIEASINDAQLQLDQAGVTEEQPENPQDMPDLSADDIAIVDRQMRDYYQQRDKFESQLQVMSLSYGSQHRLVAQARESLAVIEREIEDYTKTFNRMRKSGFADATSPAGTSVDQLRKRIALLRTRDETAKAETLEIGNKNLRIKQLKEEEDTLKDNLDEVKKRIDELSLNSNVTGRIEALNDGEPEPNYTPVNKKNKILFTGFGFTSGLSLGVGIVIVIGLLDRRMRSSEDAATGLAGVRLLGILPNLPADLDDPEQASVAGFCVHHIRTLLQLGSSRSDQKAIAVTSPASGTGKTSLTLALGMSFAGSDSRTLLIDCDLIGRALTSRLGAMIRRQIGQIFIRQGILTPEQLNKALQRARDTGNQLGQTLVEMQLINPNDLDSALALQEGKHIGLLDALAGEPIENCIATTGIPNLEILPTGSATAVDVTRISPTTVRRVLDAARDRYDAILIDTGPVPGSLETSVVACEADEVILIVSRGEQRNQAEHSMAFLRSIGAHVSGLVFNRAEGADIARSVHSASVVSRPYTQTDADNGKSTTLVPADARTKSRFGPIAGSVANPVDPPSKRHHDADPAR